MLSLIPSAESDRRLAEMARFFTNLGMRIGQDEQREISQEITRGFEMNFRTESSGSGPWPGLSPATQADRARQGYGAARPMLTRTWDYRNSLTDRNDSNHFSQVSQSSNLYAQEEGSESSLFPWHEGGTRNMPARSVTDLDSRSEESLGRTIDSMIQRLLAREGL